jgi:hypothetical protein
MEGLYADDTPTIYAYSNKIINRYRLVLELDHELCLDEYQVSTRRTMLTYSAYRSSHRVPGHWPPFAN